MNSKKPLSRKKRRSLRITEVISSLCVLALALNSTAWMSYDKKTYQVISGMFLIMVISVVSNIMLEKSGEAEKRITCMIQGVLYFVNSVITFIFAGCQRAVQVALILYLLALIADRCYPIIKTTSRVSRLLNILMIILFCFLGVMSFIIRPPTPDIPAERFSVLLISGLAVIHYLIKTIGLAFRNIRFDILLRVASRSMAVEILSGLMILVFAFSLLLTSIEPGMTSFFDALWYCFALVTTTGFGDITAVTTVGRLLSFILGAYGIIVVALVTSIIVNFYAELKNEESEKGSGKPSRDEKDPDINDNADPASGEEKSTTPAPEK